MGFQGRGTNGNAVGMVEEMTSLNEELGKFFSEAVDIIHRLQARNRALREQMEAVEQDNELLLDDNRRLRETLARRG